MSAFRRFGPEDIVDSVLTLHPEYSVASGTTGWHGGPAGSGSIFVYGGARSRPGGVLRSSDVSPSWGSSFSYNLPSRMYPMTSSIRLVTVVPTALASSQLSTTQWGEEHWDVIQGLYAYYSQYNTEYMTSSYDHYCLRFSDQSRNVGISTTQLILSSSFTIEARIKPFLTQSASGDFTILSRTNSFLFGITGSTGKLFSSSSQGSVTSSFGPPANRWSHVAARCNGSGIDVIKINAAGGGPWSNAGASSMQKLLAGTDGYVQWTVYSTESVMAGLSVTDTNQEYDTIKYGVFGFYGAFAVYELGALMYTAAASTYNVGDNIRVHRVGTVITYERQVAGTGSWVVMYTSGVAETSDLIVDTAHNLQWHGVKNIRMFQSGYEISLSMTNAVGVSVSSAAAVGSGVTFTIDLQDAGSIPCSASFGLLPSQTASLTVGAKWAGNLSGPTTTTEGQAGSGSANTSFCGLMNELRVWNVCRTQAQLSASYRTTLSGNSSASLPPGMAFYARFHDGPNSSYYGYLNGSSSIDEMTRSTGTPASFVLQKFNDRFGPIWHPSDDQTFVVPKQIPVSTSTEVFSPVNRMTVIDIPSMFYGRQIATGSVEITDQAFTSLGIKRVLVDDGRGGLYISGSICSSSLANQESYAGVKWNKVGNVFYNEGLIVIRDPALLDFGGIGSANPGASSHDPTNTFQFKFRGVSELPTKTLMCRVDPGEMNCSTNGSFYVTGSDGNRERRHTSGSVWITTVMVYDENMEPVMVIRPAQPIRHRERDRLNIKTKMDF